MRLEARCCRCLRATEREATGWDANVPMGLDAKRSKPRFVTPRAWKAAELSGVRYWWWCPDCEKDTLHASRGVWT